MTGLISSTLILAQGDDAPPVVTNQPGGTAQAPAATNGQAGTQQPAGNNPDPTNTTNTAQTGLGPDMFMWIFLIGMFVVMWLLMSMSSRKEKKKQAELLASLRKGIRVQTIGGIQGTVVEVHAEKVVLKVDENTNTRLALARGAVQKVLDEPDKSNGKAEAETSKD